jgi:isopenicillin N synthase-like dioxygenase
LLHLVAHFKELAMAKAAVPVIDISPYRQGDSAARRALAAEVDRTCRDIGFMVIAGHGVDAHLVETVESASRAFFDLPLAEKMRIVRPAPDVTRGYMPMKAEVLVRSRGVDA